MKEKHMNKKSRTDWKRIDALKDEDIDTSDIPPLAPELLRQVRLRLPVSKAIVTIRVDADILSWLKAQGRGYQTRINAILRTYMEATRDNQA